MDEHTTRIAKAWGHEIQARRTLLGYSRAALADELDVSREMVRLWENGTHAPSARLQSMLIDVLGIDPVAVAKLIQQARIPNGSAA